MKALAPQAIAGLVIASSLAGPLFATTDGATVATLAPGQNVTLTGQVERIADEDEFLLRDPTGTVLVYVGPNRVPAAQGGHITVFGVVDDDGTLEVYATAITRADGTMIDLPHSY